MEVQSSLDQRDSSWAENFAWQGSLRVGSSAFAHLGAGLSVPEPVGEVLAGRPSVQALAVASAGLVLS